VDDEFLLDAQRDAIRLAVQAQERAGLDIIGDGEISRESYSNHFANALDGIDLDNPARPSIAAVSRCSCPDHGPDQPPPRRGCRGREVPAQPHGPPIKFTVPGPFTMSQQAQDDYYGSQAAAAMDYAAAVNAEVLGPVRSRRRRRAARRALHAGAAGAAREYGLEALNRALEGVDGKTCVHICFGYAALIHARPEGYSYLPELAGACCDQISIETAQSNLDCSVLDGLPDKDILLGVLDLSTPEIEDVETIKNRVLRALSMSSRSASCWRRTAA
jgi:5-methyltetrahydropteroyltriglutamate--homocysteine methyltransferase